MLRSDPLVTVIVPTYNNGELLREALESILRQSFDGYEIVVVDDGSTDTTRDIAHSFPERVRYIYQENQGLAVARNTGLRYSKGKYLTFLDGDDLWHRDNLQMKVGVLETDGSLSAVFSNFVLFDENGVITDNGIVRQYPIFSRLNKSVDDLFDGVRLAKKLDGTEVALCVGNIFRFLLFGNFINACSIVFRKSCQKDVGLFKPDLRTQQDYEYWLRFSRGRRFAYIDEPLVEYRRHSAQLTAHKNMTRISTNIISILEPYFTNIDEYLPPGVHKEFSERFAACWVSLGLAHLRNNDNSEAARAFSASMRITGLRPRTLAMRILSCFPPFVVHLLARCSPGIRW